MSQPLFQQFLCCFFRLFPVFISKFRIPESTRSFYGSHGLETAPTKYFLKRLDYSPALVGQDIKRPHGAARTHQHTPLSFVHGNRNGQFILPHHAIHHSVEQQFQLPGHVTPVAGSPHHQGITPLYHLQHPLSVILRKHTIVSRPALHTCHTWSDLKILHVNKLNLSPITIKT